jgi:hypothetical protein
MCRRHAQKSPLRKPLVESILVTTLNDEDQPLRQEVASLQQKNQALTAELADCRERLRVLEARKESQPRRFLLESSRLLFEQLLVCKCLEKEEPALLPNRFVRLLASRADQITGLLEPFIQEHRLGKRFAREARRIKQEL